MTSASIREAIGEAFRRSREMDASLSDKLQAFAAAGRGIQPRFAEAWDELIARLKKAGAGASAPQPGEQMPDFALPDHTGRLTTLAELLEKGPVAVVFHRGHWCPYCRLNTVALAEAYDRAAHDGGQIVAITPDRQRFARAVKEDSGAAFPILTDMDNGYALSLGLVLHVSPELQQMMGARGRDLPAFQGNDSWTLPIPATFIVGTDGLVKARFIDPDFRKRMAIEDLLAALRAAAG
jgi:peroxiredoxin